jgi:hypothetical protein
VSYLDDSQSAQSPKDPKDSLAKVRGRVEAAVKWRDEAKYDDNWSTLIRMYANKYDYPELSSYQDVVAPNMVFSTVNVIVPSITVNYPKITVNAARPENQDQARVVETVANYSWRHFDVHEEFRRATKDFSIVGHGWLKTTWVYEERTQTWDAEAYRQEAERLLTEAYMQREQAERFGVSGNDFPDDDDVLAQIPKKQTVVVKDAPVVERVSPFDMFVDPDATNLRGARWLAQRMYIPFDKAVKNKAYDAEARKKLKPRAMSDAKKNQDLLFPDEEHGSEAAFVVVWEFYDLIDNKVCTFAESCDKFLIPPQDIPFAFGNPFVMLANYQVPDKLYPLGDVEVVAPLQKELALTRTQMIADRKRFQRAYMVRPDLIGPDGYDALRSGEDNAFIEVDGNEPFGEILAPIQTTSLPPEFYNQTAMILDDINLVSGVSEYQRGSMTEIRRTATEAAMIQDASNARSADKLAIIERGIGEVAKRVVVLCQQFMTTSQVARVAGPDGAMKWVEYDRDALSGEFDFEVEAGSTQPQNETFRRQSAMQIMDAMAPFIEMGVVDPQKLAEHVLRFGFGVKQPGDFMTQPPMGGMPPDMPPGVPPNGAADMPSADGMGLQSVA